MSILVRCTGCSKAAYFHATRGARLIEMSCSSCGSRFERVMRNPTDKPYASNPKQTWVTGSGVFEKNETMQQFLLIEKIEPKRKAKSPVKQIADLEIGGIIRLYQCKNGQSEWVNFTCSAGDKITWKRNGARGSVNARIIGWTSSKPCYVKVENWRPDWSNRYDQRAQVWIKIRSVISILQST